MTSGAFLTLLDGALVTLAACAAGVAIGMPLGLLFAVARWVDLRFFGRSVAIYVSVVRSTPVVTLALLVFFGLPSLGIEIGSTVAAIILLAVNTSAFNCEVWRSGLNTFQTDQIEAAKAFGMTSTQLFRRIIFPQLWRQCLPALINEVTMLIKSSPAIAVIGVVDITRAAIRVGAETYDPFPPMLAATLLYCLIIASTIVLQRVLEKRHMRRVSQDA
jgi:His/Glu/Gln/Arg/opine family amino acid ABC transporter permease subunit